MCKVIYMRELSHHLLSCFLWIDEGLEILEQKALIHSEPNPTSRGNYPAYHADSRKKHMWLGNGWMLSNFISKTWNMIKSPENYFFDFSFLSHLLINIFVCFLRLNLVPILHLHTVSLNNYLWRWFTLKAKYFPNPELPRLITQRNRREDFIEPVRKDLNSFVFVI